MWKLYYELEAQIENLWVDYQDPSTNTRTRQRLSDSMDKLVRQQEQALCSIREDKAKQFRGDK